jgi:hypothetical protein
LTISFYLLNFLDKLQGYFEGYLEGYLWSIKIFVFQNNQKKQKKKQKETLFPKKEICFVVCGAILQGVPLLFRITLASKPLGSLIGVWLGSLWHFKSTQLLLWHV